MKMKRVIVGSLLVSMMFMDLSAAVAQPRENRVAQANQANSAFQTLKEDMRCLFSRKRTCTPKQKRRIMVQAGVVLAAIAALAGGAFFWKWRLSKRAEARREARKDLYELVMNKEYEKIGEITGKFPELKLHILLLAIQEGDEPLVDELLEKGADIDGIDDLGLTPLMVAVEAGNIKMVAHLLYRGADIDKANSVDGTPLYYAFEGYLYSKHEPREVRDKWENMVRLLLNKDAKFAGFLGPWKNSLPQDDPVRKMLEERLKEQMRSEQ